MEAAANSVQQADLGMIEDSGRNVLISECSEPYTQPMRYRSRFDRVAGRCSAFLAQGQSIRRRLIDVDSEAWAARNHYVSVAGRESCVRT